MPPLASCISASNVALESPFPNLIFLRVARGGQQPEPPALGAMSWLRCNAQAWKAFLLVGGVLLVVAAIAAGVAFALGVSEPSLFPALPDAQTPFGILHFTTGGITLG